MKCLKDELKQVCGLLQDLSDADREYADGLLKVAKTLALKEFKGWKTIRRSLEDVANTISRFSDGVFAVYENLHDIASPKKKTNMTKMIKQCIKVLDTSPDENQDKILHDLESEFLVKSREHQRELMDALNSL